MAGKHEMRKGFLQIGRKRICFVVLITYRCSSLNVMYRRSCARYRAFVIGRGWQATVFLLAVDGIVGAPEGSN